MSLADSLKGVDLSQPSRKGPLWTGPNGEGDNGGVTQGLLGKFLACRERFRIKVIEGLVPSEGWNHRTGFGNMWHVAEEALAKGDDPTRGGREDRKVGLWERHLQDYATNLCRRFPLQQEQVDHWHNVCKRQFPEYVKYWSAHPDVTNRTPLLQEQTFDVPYRLPSGRTVRLRGKWDSVDLVGETCGVCNGGKGVSSAHTGRFHPCATCNGEGRRSKIWLQENKSKGDINEAQLKRQLASGFELQTGFYTTALTCDTGIDSLEEVKQRIGTGKMPHERSLSSFAGVKYNVIRRPLSGGKGTIVRGKGTAGSKCPKCKGTGFPGHQPGHLTPPCPKCIGFGKVGGKPPETKEAYYDRMVDYIREAPETYFMRFNIGVTSGDIQRFRNQCLDPLLEQMCLWYDWVMSGNPWRKGNTLHSVAPYGIYNPMAEGGEGDMDAYLNTGSTAGLARVSELFPELEEVQP